MLRLFLLSLLQGMAFSGRGSAEAEVPLPTELGNAGVGHCPVTGTYTRRQGAASVWEGSLCCVRYKGIEGSAPFRGQGKAAFSLL